MRPSSGGSRRISKRFLPASALADDFDGDAGERHCGGRRCSRGGGSRVCGGGRSVLRRSGQRGLLSEVTGCLLHGGLGVGRDRRRSFHGGAVGGGRGCVARADGGFIGIAGRGLRLALVR